MASKETTLELIEDYRKLPVLWSKKHPLYKHRQTRIKHLKLLAKKYGVPVPVMEKRIHNLRSQFTREHKEQLKKTKLTFPRRSWYGYEKMLFLKDDWQGVEGGDVNSEGSFSDLSDGDAWDMGGDFDDMIASSVVDAKDTKLIPVIDVDADSSESLPELEADTTPTVSSSSAKQRATRKPIPGPSARMQWAKAKQAAPKRDEYAVYGEYVGEKMRNAGKSRLEIARAQQDMEAIFIKLESGIYGKPG